MLSAVIRVCCVLSLIIVGFTSAAAQDASYVYPGEELTYRVSYLNITLGTIKTIVEPFTTYNGKKAVKVKVYIDSHPNIPFVSLHAVYESWMDSTSSYSNKFTANTMVEENKWEFDQYIFDYDKKKIFADKFRDKQKIGSKTFDIKKRYNDGSSLLFAARSLLNVKKSLRLPTVIMDDTVNTVINFNGTKEAINIDASSYPVKTVFFSGDANWTGIYGLSGRFEGWFSDDEARVPIKATIKLYVGSATIELQSWRRGKWQPPKAD
ncbi:MAG: DUF3108 domain-containing protein [Ignavibacteria bacterium]|nr:DUF3108 domain-containing protein [Ignavibacteria bacterium]